MSAVHEILEKLKTLTLLEASELVSKIENSTTMIEKDMKQKLDDVEKKCFSDRLEHYCYLSMSPLPNKSQLYSTIY